MSEPKKLREFWISEEVEAPAYAVKPAAQAIHNYVHVREVLPDEVVLTREEFDFIKSCVRKVESVFQNSETPEVDARPHMKQLIEFLWLGKKGGA